MAAATLFIAAGCARSSTQQAQIPTGPIQATTTASNEVPAGTTFAVLTSEAIVSNTVGATFDAEVHQDIVNQSGQVLIPEGSPAQLVVLAVDDGGVASTPTVQLGLRSMTVRGRQYDVTSGGVTREGNEGLGANRRTAEIVGGGAAIGTVLGAIVGGGQGAAVGAATGAAVGAAAQVYTRGDQVQVPAETALRFQLNQTLMLE
jgi:hypothetical protein